MARCLPFPPPGYVWNGKSGDDLLELIKVQREKVKAERERKKEKKRKKHHKKKGREEGDQILVETQGHHNRLKRLRSGEFEGISKSSQGKRTEFKPQEQKPERSSLSKEQEQELEHLLFDSLDASSDNSQSIQRKRRMSCIGQIDFHHQKHKTKIPETLVSSKPECLRTRINDMDEKSEMTLTQLKPIASACGLPTITTNAQELAASPLKPHLHPCTTSQRAWTNDNEKKSAMAPTPGRCAMSLWQMESKYREYLVKKWVPPPLDAEPDIGDEDWLFKKKQPRSEMTDTNTASYDALHQGNFTHYSRAQYLPNADIYALPYTVPY